VSAYDGAEPVLKERIRGCSVLVFRSGVNISADVMAESPALQLVLRAGSGCDNIDIDHVRRRGIQLERVPGPGAKAVSEMAFALMLNLARNIRMADDCLRRGQWVKQAATGYLLTGKTLGVVGCGNIGTRVGQLGHAWGMTVVACVANFSPERAEALAREGIELTTLAAVLAQSDYVSVHVPKSPLTTGLINARTLRQVKRGAFLINLARGGVVDEGALRDALVSGHLRGAALDVHELEGEGKISPLAGLENVILTPHIGAGTYDSQRELGQIVVNRIRAFEEQAEAVAR
jgi:phosphoglycerate dehydrogenase-like enzyme